MKDITRREIRMMQIFQRARIIAIVGVSPRSERHSYTVTSYLHRTGYDVIPVRNDFQRVDGLKSYARLADIPAPVDVAVIYRRADAAPQFIGEAAAKGTEAIWLPPSVWTREAEKQAREHGVELFKDRCIEENHRHVSKDSGHPERLGIHGRRRRGSYEDDRKKKMIERIGKAAAIPQAEAEAGRAAAESARCSMRKRWRAASPRQEAARTKNQVAAARASETGQESGVTTCERDHRGALELKLATLQVCH